MSTHVQSRYREVPVSAAQTLVGALGGNTAVPFYYNRLYNLNRDGSANVIQWGDAIRGYQGTPPVLQVASAAPTYDASRGVIFGGSGNTLAGAVSTAYGLSAGSVIGGITTQRLQTFWMVGEIDPLNVGAFVTLSASSPSDFVNLGTLAAGAAYSVWLNGSTANAATGTGVVTDGTIRLVIMTLVTGGNHGIQVPTHSANATSSLGEPTRTTQPYTLLIGGTGIGAVAEMGGLTRSPTAADLTLLQNNAVSVHGATL